MLCQNCGSKEASVHLTRILNGETVELHLCRDCAAATGYGDLFSGFAPDAAALFGALGQSVRARGARMLRCETCGLSFEEIAAAGALGCPDCYRTFAEKLQPLLQKLHGKAKYLGKRPGVSAAGGDGSGEEV